MWGDNGKECSFYSLLPSLFAIRKYADGEQNEEKIKQEFYELFGIHYDDFITLDKANTLPVERTEAVNDHPCKGYLYTDCFTNIFEKTFENPGVVDYISIANEIEEAGKRAGDFSYIFTELASLCRVLDIKATICKKTRDAYENKDKAALSALLLDYAELEKRIAIFHEAFYTLWHKENKPFGWEIHDARLGGLMQRVRTCRRRLSDYLEGRIENIEELEAELLVIFKDRVYYNLYTSLISTSSI